MREPVGITRAALPHVSQADELQVRTDAFADRCIALAKALPDTPLIRRIAGQFQDAATSVGANYRAARRAKSRADFTSKIGTVSEEADETVYWLKRLQNSGIDERGLLTPLLQEAEQLARIFGAAHRTALRRRKAR